MGKSIAEHCEDLMLMILCFLSPALVSFLLPSDSFLFPPFQVIKFVQIYPEKYFSILRVNLNRLAWDFFWKSRYKSINSRLNFSTTFVESPTLLPTLTWLETDKDLWKSSLRIKFSVEFVTLWAPALLISGTKTGNLLIVNWHLLWAKNHLRQKNYT